MENSNLPAFPAHDGNMYYGGMTKREYFSAMAMQGLLSNPNNLFNRTPNDLNEIALSRSSVELADALLKALETPKQ